MKKSILAPAGAIVLVCLAFLADEHHAFAQSAVPTMSRKTETLACVTPCSVSANNTLIFSDTEPSSNPAGNTVPTMRVKWSCRNVGAADAYLCRGATCSSAAYDFLLTTAGKDSYTEDTGSVWAGKISAASSGTTLACAGLVR